METRNRSNRLVERFAHEDLQIIGKGAYGVVYRAVDRENGNNIVALKKVRIPLTVDGIPNSALREIGLLKQINTFNHQNIVKLLDVCHAGTQGKELVLYLVFDHLEQDLAGFIRKHKHDIPRYTIQKLSRDLLKGVDFLHTHRIIHRDLKPQNLLISQEGTLLIGDFGLAKIYDFDMKLTSVVVTLWYRAPEILLNQSYNTTVDIWSVACIIAEMFMKQPLFPGISELDQLEKILHLTGKPRPSDWPSNIPIIRDSLIDSGKRQPKELCSSLCDNANDLLSEMLEFNPELRLSAASCLQHKYFTEEPMH